MIDLRAIFESGVQSTPMNTAGHSHGVWTTSPNLLPLNFGGLARFPGTGSDETHFPPCSVFVQTHLIIASELVLELDGACVELLLGVELELLLGVELELLLGVELELLLGVELELLDVLLEELLEELLLELLDELLELLLGVELELVEELLLEDVATGNSCLAESRTRVGFVGYRPQPTASTQREFVGNGISTEYGQGLGSFNPSMTRFPYESW